MRVPPACHPDNAPRSRPHILLLVGLSLAACDGRGLGLTTQEDAGADAGPGSTTIPDGGPPSSTDAGVAPGVDAGFALPSDTGQVVLSAGWGDDASGLGRVAPEEANPEGPMSFTVHPDGSIYVLDQVNERVQVYAGGSFVRSIPIPGGTFQDIALATDGSIVLLDRFTLASVVLLAADGSISRQVALEGSGVPVAAGVSALISRSDGLWVEAEDGLNVRIATPQGDPDPTRLVAPGRHGANGTTMVRSELTGEITVTLTVGSGSSWRQLPIYFDIPVAEITAFGTDPTGRVLLTVRLLEEGNIEREELVVLTSTGREVARIPMTLTSLEHETFRPTKIADDGSVYHLVVQGPNALVKRYQP